MLSRGVDVKERRLKTIYDALDASNNKKAIQEAEKVLRKDPLCQTAKALKGLALFRGNRNIEASLLLNELSREQPSDEACLQAMTYYYREAGFHEKISEIYENANKKKPSNEDIMTTLFMAHVRLMNFQRQHQIARDLHKLIPSKMPYFFWSVMSLFMQAKSAENGLGAKMFLPLAEKMVKKVIDDGKLKAEAEFELYLMILEEQQKFEESLEFLTSSPLTDKVLKDQNTVTRYELEYLRRLKRDYGFHVKSKELLVKNPDDWSLLKEYLERGLRIIGNNLNISNGSCSNTSTDSETSASDITYKSLYHFLDTLRKDNSYMRGPHLARFLFIQLTKHLDAVEDAPEVGDPVDLMGDYFSRFGGKPVCPFDLLMFFDELIGINRQAELIEKLETLHLRNDDGDSVGLPKHLNAMYERLCIEMLKRKSGYHMQFSHDERNVKVKELLELHQHSLQFGSQLERTEHQPADGFILLVVLLTFDEWLDSINSEEGVKKPQSILWRAVLIIESALLSSPCNHHLKICLLKIYCLLGAYQPALNTFHSLEIKHMQYDSLGYLISKQGLHLASFSAALGVWNNVVKFFAVNRKDMMEYVVSAYRSGSFRKIPEFIEFHKRLSNSFEYHSSNVELQLQTVFSNSSKFEEMLQTFSDLAYDVDNDIICYESLVDGRDFDVTERFEPKNSPNEFTGDQQKASFADELHWLRLRALTTRIFAVSCKLVMEGSKHVTPDAKSLNNDTTSKEDSKFTDTTLTLINELNQLQEKVESSPYKISNSSLLSPYASANSLYLHGCYSESLKDGMNLIIYVTRLVKDHEAHDPVYESSLKDTLLVNVLKFKEEIISSKDQCFAETLTRLVCLSETLSILTIFLMSAVSLFKPFRKPQTKRKKKNPTAAEVSPLCRSIAPLDEAMIGVCDTASDLRQFIEELDESWKTVADLDYCLESSDMELKEETIELVRKQAEGSYSSSLNELSRMLDYVSARRTSHN